MRENSRSFSRLTWKTCSLNLSQTIIISISTSWIWPQGDIIKKNISTIISKTMFQNKETTAWISNYTPTNFTGCNYFSMTLNSLMTAHISPYCGWSLQRRHNGRLKSPASPLFTQPFIEAQIKENIKAPRHWPLWGEFTVDRWIPRKNGQ